MTATVPTHISGTCATTVAVPCDVLVAYVSDPLNLPAWAPDFAAVVTPAADGTWSVRSPDGERRIVVRTSAELGVVDFVSAADPQLGAFMRVLPSGTASHVTFTLLFPGTAGPEDVDAAMRGAAQELGNLRGILDVRPGHPGT